MENPLVLKKYSNRRLYDTEKSIYVTLNEVADIVRGGRQVRVLDAKTREDVTAFILTQIVLEEARKKNALLPVPLLHLIIRYGNSLGEFFENYLQQIIQVYLGQKAAFEDQFKHWVVNGMSFAGKGLGDLTGLKSLFELNPLFNPRFPNDSQEKEPRTKKK